MTHTKSTPLNQGYLYPVDSKDLANLPIIPLQEYPRPNLKRNSYLCLNGSWDFEISKSSVIPASFTRRILVPFAVESKVSGVEKLVEPDDYLYYRREVTLPEGFVKKHLLLHFDGVDQTCDVYLNDEKVFSHVGGYTKFTVEVPLGLAPHFTLTLRVRDVTDQSYHERGKQRLVPNGWFYTSSSGIYFPVWMESVGSNYVEQVFFRPNYDEKNVAVRIVSPREEKARITIGKDSFAIKTNQEAIIPLYPFRAWSPKDPYLYPVTIKLKEDEVSSYFGVRKIEIRLVKGYQQIFLNDEKIFLTGLLDQGYFYPSNLTPFDYADYIRDVHNAKALGFNVLRKHIKIEEDLFYYECDKQGMLVIQDFPCGGTPYRFWNVVKPRLFDNTNDYSLIKGYKYLSRQDEAGRKEFDHECQQWTDSLMNYPSIIIYTIFNEGWGEFDPREHYLSLKAKDPSRLYDSASGWYISEYSDFYSIHAYDFTHHERKSKYGHPFMLSEIGGIALKISDHFYFPKVYGHHTCKTRKALSRKYQHLYEKDIIPLKKKGCLVGAIYTQLSDCETEANGLFTFDRKVLKIDARLLRKINAELTELSLDSEESK
jgi:hypothetical protein